jgi:hypothetical protein
VEQAVFLELFNRRAGTIVDEVAGGDVIVIVKRRVPIAI